MQTGVHQECWHYNIPIRKTTSYFFIDPDALRRPAINTTRNTPPDPTLAYQDLRPDDILDSVESLGLRCDGRLLPLNSYENRVYRVGLEDGPPVVAKFYRPGRWSDPAIEEEHAFAAELAQRDVPVVAPLLHNDRRLHRHGAFRFSVSPQVAGREPELDEPATLRQVGRLVARLHLTGETGRFQHRPQLTPHGMGARSADYLLRHGFLPEALVPAYDSLSRDLLRAVERAWDNVQARTLRIHGDLHPGNVLVHNGQIRVVDLDDCVDGPAMQDLWMFLSGDRQEQEPQLAELLAGYTEFRPFPVVELLLVEPLRSLRMMHYAAWLARRWEDPAFQLAFPWFGTPRYWDQHVLALREQLALMQEQPLEWRPPQAGR